MLMVTTWLNWIIAVRNTHDQPSLQYLGRVNAASIYIVDLESQKGSVRTTMPFCDWPTASHLICKLSDNKRTFMRYAAMAIMLHTNKVLLS